MIDVDYLSRLLLILKSSGVSTFKSQGLELEFKDEKLLGPGPAKVNEQVEATVTQDTFQDVPPDFKATDDMNFDKILNWSASPDQDPELPLTGDTPLEV